MSPMLFSRRSVLFHPPLFSLLSMNLARDNRFQSIEMYTEVIQDSIFDLLDTDKLRFASTTALTFSSQGQIRFFKELDQLKSKFILRPMEISNHPEVIRRIGLITMNTALEADIYGNVNSTHVLGSAMMNGIGGSGDFTRNAVRFPSPRPVSSRLSRSVLSSSTSRSSWRRRSPRAERSRRSFRWSLMSITMNIQCKSWSVNKAWPIFAPSVLENARD